MQQNKLLDLLGGFLLLDGAMGSMLQSAGIEFGHWPEVLNRTHPEEIQQIHHQYVENGSNIILTNTFGANEAKLEGCAHSVEEIVTAAVQNAKAAADGRAFTALDVGPIGELLEPAGSLKFERAYEIFRRQILAGATAGADLIYIETMSDLLEVKAAVLAAKECCSLPVFCTMSYEQNRRTFTGTTLSAQALTLEGLGVDALGINCSLGPVEIRSMAKELSEWTRLPIIAKPNAGLPNLESEQLQYDIDSDSFARTLADFADFGVTIFGGCCGTTPDYIRKLKAALMSKTVQGRAENPRFAICSASRTVEMDGVRIIGERINPTGKKLFKEALKNDDLDYILGQGISQADAGAHILDVNVGLPEIDEARMMVRTVQGLQGILDLPLQIDSSDPSAIEAALRVYNGKPLVNSVNGEDKILDRILPLVKKYGSAVVGLTLDEHGIPATAEGRFAIAEKILSRALTYGIRREDVYIDCLVLTASAEQDKVVETLKAVKMVKERLGLKTVLGVSNISFGLPSRELINATFLTLAMAHGLDLPILNPNNKAMTGAIDAFNVLYNRDPASTQFIERHADMAKTAPAAPLAVGDNIEYAISKGLKEETRLIAQRLLENTDELTLINSLLIPALDQVGSRFEKGEIFLPQLIQSAEAAKAAFDVVKARLAQTSSSTVSKGKIALATVKGDIHDIGKNIVKVILENYGYQIIDLGRDVPVETIVETVKNQDIHLVGLSALMTTTIKSMEETICALHSAGCDCKIWVGGAVLTPDYAAKMGADFYACDAKASVDIAKQILG